MNLTATARHLSVLHVTEIFMNAEGGSLPSRILCSRQTPSYTPPASTYNSTKCGRVREVMTDTSDMTTLLSNEQFRFAFGHEVGLVCPVQILAGLEQAEIFKGSARVHYDEMIRCSRISVALEIIRTITQRDVDAEVQEVVA